MTKWFAYRWWFVCALLVVGLAGSVLWKYTVNTSAPLSYIVHYTGSTFEPRVLVVPVGATVIFKNDSLRSVWPASDFHPTHGLYPEFDPKRSIPKGEEWVFVFTKAGEWQYHNHLLPSQTGSVLVGESNSGVTALGSESCLEEKGMACWQMQLAHAVETKGLASALELVAQLYAAEPTFRADCHGYMHKLGEAAARDYMRGMSMPEHLDTLSYCGYGYYHGFVEALLLSEGEGELARIGAYCQSLQSQSAVLDVEACFHGLGHGIFGVVMADESLWGKAVESVYTAAGKCRVATALEVSYARCVSGVFMEFSSAVAGGEYDLHLDTRDPYAFCEQVEEVDKIHCYTQLYGAVKEMTGGDFAEGLQLVARIGDVRYAQEAVRTFVGADPDVSNERMRSKIVSCRTSSEALRSPCLEGVVLSVLLNGSPGQEYAQAEQLCSDKSLMSSEREQCLVFIAEFAGYNKKGETVREVCALMPSVRRPQICKQ